MIELVIGIYLSGVSNGVMDGTQFLNYWLNKYAWFQPELSALNKWEHAGLPRFLPTKYSTYTFKGIPAEGKMYYVIESKQAPWYYLYIYKPKYIEAFPYSSTFLVFLTQGWHLAKLFTFDILLLIITMLIVGNNKVNFDGWVVPEVWYSYPITFFVLKIIIGLGFTTSYR